MACLALAVLAACAPGVEDLRLEEVRRTTGADRRLLAADPRMSGRIEAVPVVAEVSSRHDMRRAARGYVEDILLIAKCDGREALGTGFDDPRLIGTSRIYDRHGPVWEDRAAVPLGDPRYRYLMPLRLFLGDDGGVGNVGGGAATRVVAAGDVCVVGRAVNYLRGIWRTNTVVVPHAMIRAALGAGD
ncbi:MAG: hypothetical protein K2X11_11285 [Acetobacteraceae bacterium]|nr:hypothetical protein [Acetobacteraceae bacterium]